MSMRAEVGIEAGVVVYSAGRFDHGIGAAMESFISVVTDTRADLIGRDHGVYEETAAENVGGLGAFVRDLGEITHGGQLGQILVGVPGSRAGEAVARLDVGGAGLGEHPHGGRAGGARGVDLGDFQTEFQAQAFGGADDGFQVGGEEDLFLFGLKEESGEAGDADEADVRQAS